MSTNSPKYYQNPIVLDKTAHKSFKIKKQDSYAFASAANSAPVAGFEFFETSRHFPIFFVKNPEGDFLPLAVLSFRKDGHDLGDQWQDVYVPVYFRRYPFILSSDGLVMFDEAAPHVQEEDGDDLFDDKGELTEAAKEIVQFLDFSDKGYRATGDFSQALKDKDLLEPFKGELSFPEGKVNLGEVYAINEKKLYESLTPEEVNTWFTKGWLAWSYAHLHSVGAVSQIVKRARDAAKK